MFIPSKWNKAKFKFGFVKYVDVKNIKILQDELNGIWFGSYKLRSHLAIFYNSFKNTYTSKVSPSYSISGGANSLIPKASYQEVIVKVFSLQIFIPFVFGDVSSNGCNKLVVTEDDVKLCWLYYFLMGILKYSPSLELVVENFALYGFSHIKAFMLGGLSSSEIV